ncbi:hypothetical protein [Vibrio phage vB_VpaP_M3]|nr:hypothetical protein [Vibrio phage vB_VpaP_M3]
MVKRLRFAGLLHRFVLGCTRLHWIGLREHIVLADS